ncbi:TPA: hypothetical protein JA361_12880 [Legionella pneumophila]|nr:hypothetical protein [Legionella pneumophila]
MLKMKHYLIQHSPGIVQLEQASKTILAILTTLFLLKNETLGLKLLAAICCGISIQTVSASNLLSRLYQILIFDTLFTLVFYLGFLVKNSEILMIFFLTGLGFIVNYCRTFGLEKSPAPFMIWLLGFIATLLPSQDFSSYATPLWAFLYGFSVSVPFVLFVFPSTDSIRLYQKNNRKLIQLLARGMKQFIKQNSYKSWLKIDDRLSYQRAEKQMYLLLSLNQQIISLNHFDVHKKQKTQTQIHYYALVSAYTMFIHSFNSISINTFKLPNEIYEAIKANSLEIEMVLLSLSAAQDLSTKKSFTSINLINFIQSISQYKIDHPQLIGALIQISHCFDLMKHHIEELIRGDCFDT